jgi:hypothetical protein
MKLKTIMITCLTWALTTFFVHAQDNTQLFLIHEDIVIPAKSSQYDEASKSLKKALVDNNVTGFGYMSFWQNDNTVIHVQPISNYAELDKDFWKELSDKMGKDETEALFAKYEGTYHSHRDFVAVFHPDLSYKPEQAQEGDYIFREWTFLYYDSKDEKAMFELMEEWKLLYESKNIENGYSIFTAGVGHYGPVIVVYGWAQNEQGYAENNEKNMETLGEERQALMGKTNLLIQKIETKRGWFQEEISYLPGQ